jgi:hypothetical protein
MERQLSSNQPTKPMNSCTYLKIANGDTTYKSKGKKKPAAIKAAKAKTKAMIAEFKAKGWMK